MEISCVEAESGVIIGAPSLGQEHEYKAQHRQAGAADRADVSTGRAGMLTTQMNIPAELGCFAPKWTYRQGWAADLPNGHTGRAGLLTSQMEIPAGLGC